MKISKSLSFLFLLFVTCFVSAQTIQEQLNNGAKPHALVASGVPKDSLWGKIYQGGYIFYLFEKDSGMVMGPEYLSYPYDKTKQMIIWSCRGVDTKAKETKIGSGMRNSLKIKNAECTLYDPDEMKWMHSAAEICLIYKGSGYVDWFLPSKDELHEAWLHLAKTNIVQFDEKLLWSSSEKNHEFAWIQFFSQGPREYDKGGQSYYMKFYEYSVRPVRVFK